VNFTNLSQFADPATYQWQFGAGQGTSQAIDPTYTYSTPGIYSVTLTASNSMGIPVSITKSQIIEVFDTPFAQFNINTNLVYIPGKIYTKNTSTGAGSYEWDFGDGEKSTEFEPIHTYTIEGVFDITLIATDVSGCSDTARLESIVRTEQSAELLLPNAFTPNKSGPGNTDGTNNDAFLPIARGVTEFQMMIFNRWGQLLFESKNLEVGWDGYFEGQLCKQDVYVYRITAKYANGDVITRIGDVNLIR
jgi:gliding motility-associated-like protein